MKALKHTARVISAAAAVAVTTVLFANVVSLAEPQRSTLIAKSAIRHSPAAASTTVRVATAR